jgi:hypothetical protein
MEAAAELQNRPQAPGSSWRLRPAPPRACVSAPMRPNNIRQHWQRMRMVSSSAHGVIMRRMRLIPLRMGPAASTLAGSRVLDFLEGTAFRVGLLCGGKAGVGRARR